MSRESVREYLSRIQQKLLPDQVYWIRLRDQDDYEHLSFYLKKDTDFDKFTDVFDQDLLDAEISDWFHWHDEEGYTIFINADIEL